MIYKCYNVFQASGVRGIFSEILPFLGDRYPRTIHYCRLSCRLMIFSAPSTRPMLVHFLLPFSAFLVASVSVFRNFTSHTSFFFHLFAFLFSFFLVTQTPGVRNVTERRLPLVSTAGGCTRTQYNSPVQC